LFQADEMLGPILASIHNITYYQRLVAGAREAIAADSFADFRSEKFRGWGVDPAEGHIPHAAAE
jgi:queuine tRNA-ribosyltransferase